LTLPTTQLTPFMASLRNRRLWEGVSKSCIWREGGRRGLGGGGEGGGGRGGGRSGWRGLSTRPEIAQPFPSLVITAEGVTAR
jgi:hypothetical protein